VIEVGQNEVGLTGDEPAGGELLAERLARGPLAPEEALRYAIEIGAALNRAHLRGMVHGGLSPYSVLLANTGARVLQPLPEYDERAAPYRSPEQVRGEAPDWRSDVFAYGALLYEMASGRRAFPGEGAELNDAIVEQPAAGLMAKSPIHGAMEGVIAGCLEKDPSRRRQRIQNAVIELKLAGRSLQRMAEVRHQQLRRPVATGAVAAPARERIAQPAAPAPVGAPKVPRRQSYIIPELPVPTDALRRRFWAIGAALIAVAFLSIAAVLYLHQQPAAPVLRFAVSPPEHTSYPGTPSVSPDGRFLTFSALGPEGKRMLWLRPLDALHASVISGTEGGFAPFWSPDSNYIAFFANKSLKKVRTNGGAPEIVCSAEAMPGGGAWSHNGVILFAPSLADGLYRVAENGGKPQLVLKLDSSKLERSYLWPQFLPDDKHFVFFVQTDIANTTGVYTGTLDPPEHHRLFSSETNAVYSGGAAGDSSKSGYLLFMRDRHLMEQSFNISSLTMGKDPFTLADDIGAVRSMALAPISVSDNGILVYQSVGKPTRQMVWFDRGGRQVGQVAEPGDYGPPRISPDGRRAAVAKLGPDGVNADLWILDANGNTTQFTATPKHEGSPVWSPDGSKIAYFSNPEGVYDIYVKPVNGEGRAELFYKSTLPKYPTDWSRDGRYMLFGVIAPGTRSDVWAITTADRKAAPILDTIYSEGFAALSPDGRWLAFQSDQSGRNEVYVQPFEGATSGTRRRWLVSSGGGGLPRWRGDGAEMFYMTSGGRMMAVALHPVGGDFQFEQAHMLFQTRPIPETWNLYDVSSDGQRFLLNLPLEWSSAAPITVVTNWTEKLKQ
jgi:Tol biopolymer transport system component